MTTESGAERASAILRDLQSAATAQDLTAMLGLFTEDAVVVGTSAANLDRDAVSGYLGGLFELPHSVRWDFDTVRVVDSRDGAITFVALGTVGFEGSAEPREAFRLTCLAVHDGDRWRIALFHGSIPAT